MDFKEKLEQLFSGEVYDSTDIEILKFQMKLIQKVNAYNKVPLTNNGIRKRNKMLHQMLGGCGEDVYIETPFHANFGGSHVFIGNHFYANFNLTLVDDGLIKIGDHVFIGPNVTIATAQHPKDHELRAKGYQYNLPVVIGNNVWIGSNAVVLPGVTIGDNTIIGAGSIVTKDIPSNVIAVGNPCKVIKENK